MATLFTNEQGELCVTLRGEAEDCILTTVRGWPHWVRADITRDPADNTRCMAITLITQATHEATVREILKRSFGLIFPAQGGSKELPPPLPPTQRSHSKR